MKGGDMMGMFKQAQKMQKDMMRIQEELKERVVEGSAGGGVVKAMVNGQKDLVAIKIDPSVVDPEDVEMLEDLVLSAITAGMNTAGELQQEEMGKITGGLNIPGLGL